MNFSSDAMADFEGLLEVNRKICKQQMAEKASPTLPTNCAVLPKETAMLIQATREDIRRYADAAYTLALKPESSCYPTYCDGIKTKADFLRAAEAAQASGTSELLLFQQQDRFKGWLSYDWIPEDAYLQLTGCSVAHGVNEALSELLDRLEAQFAGYTAYFGFPGENREALHFLSSRGSPALSRPGTIRFSSQTMCRTPITRRSNESRARTLRNFGLCIMQTLKHIGTATAFTRRWINGRFLYITKAMPLLLRSFSPAAMDIMKSTARNLPRAHSKRTYFKRW